MNMKKLFLLLCITTCVQAVDLRDFPPLYLTNKKLLFIDGIPGIMDGKEYGKTMKLRLEVNQKRFGKKDGDKYIGLYNFEESSYSLSDLMQLEEELQSKIHQDATCSSRLQDLYSYLKNHIIEEFLILTQPFLAQASGPAKKEMIALIEEWAYLAKRTDSLLLEWGKSKEGQESEVLRTKVKTIKTFERFCADLVYFLETMMRSCTIATQQYIDSLKEKEKQAKASK